MDDDTTTPSSPPEPETPTFGLPETGLPETGLPVTRATEKEPWKPSWRTWVAVGAGAAVVGAAAVFGISAATSSDSSNAAVSSQAPAANQPGGAGQSQAQGGQPGFRRGPGGFGTIASIEGSKLTIKDRSGATTKVVTTSATAVTTSASGTTGDIKVGDTVTVVGTGSSPNIAATRVTDDGVVSSDANGPGGFAGPGGNGGPPGGGSGQGYGGRRFGGPGAGGQAPGGASGTTFTRGVVQSAGDGTFTVTGLDGNAVTVTTTSSTEVTVSKPGSLSDLKVGDTIMVRGQDSNGTITATSIREGALVGFGGPPPGAGGDGAPSGVTQ